MGGIVTSQPDRGHHVPALEAVGLSKRYRRRFGLRDCSLSIPEGRIVALVGANGAGKSTFLRMAAGLSRPTTGSIRVFGRAAASQTTDVLERVAYLDQERPLMRSFRVSEMLRLGRELNPRWDDKLAHRSLERSGIDIHARVRELSVGQQAQVALAVCVAKRADLLLLDEPAAALDPLARSQLMSTLLESVADRGTTVVFASHAVNELENFCDHVIILSSSKVLLSGDLESVLSEHRVLVGPVDDVPEMPPGGVVVDVSRTPRQSMVTIRAPIAVGSAGEWTSYQPSLEEVVLAYLRSGEGLPIPGDASSARRVASAFSARSRSRMRTSP